MLRYCARPAFANKQIALKERGAIEFSPAKPTPKGETLLRLKPEEFLDKVAQLIPPPHETAIGIMVHWQETHHFANIL